MTALLSDGLVSRGHHVTLFATGNSVTKAALYASYPRGYTEDDSLWPWELCELFNVAAAVERAAAFDVIHCQAEYYPMSLAYSRVCSTTLLHTLHHAPTEPEVDLWSRYPEAPFVAVSDHQRRLLNGLNVVATIHHAVDTEVFAFRRDPEDYLLFLGRLTPGKGVVEAVETARRTGMRLLVAAAENEYYREVVAPLLNDHDVVFVGEVDRRTAAGLLAGARALIYPVQTAEPFGLVLAEAASCGTASCTNSRTGRSAEPSSASNPAMPAPVLAETNAPCGYLSLNLSTTPSSATRSTLLKTIRMGLA